MPTLEEIYTKSISPAPLEIIPIDGDNVVDVRGEGGKLRHRGNLSPNNPYRSQLALASTNADRDALFELAVKWEADRSQDQWQLEQNRQILEEQRRYDDPTARIARERRAGINPDIAGTSGGAGSSGGSSSMPYQAPDSDVTDSNASFYNTYDNVNSFFNGLNAVSNVVSSVTSSITGINAFRESIKTFPTRSSILDSQAQSAQTTANIAEATQDSTISAVNASNHYSKITQAFDTAMQLATLFPNDSSTKDKRDFLTALGFNTEDIDSVLSTISTISQTPIYKDLHNRQQLALNESSGKIPYYNQTYYQTISDFNTRFSLDTAEADARTAKFKNLIGQLSQTESNAENIASAELITNATKVEQAKLIRDNIKSVCDAIQLNIVNRQNIVTKLIDERTRLENLYKPTGKPFFDKYLPKMPAEVQARIDAINNQIDIISTRSNADLDAIYSIANQFYSTKYLSQQTTNSQGGATPVIGNKKYDYQNAITFGNMPVPTSSDGGELFSFISKFIF